MMWPSWCEEPFGVTVEELGVECFEFVVWLESRRSAVLRGERRPFSEPAEEDI